MNTSDRMPPTMGGTHTDGTFVSEGQLAHQPAPTSQLVPDAPAPDPYRARSRFTLAEARAFAAELATATADPELAGELEARGGIERGRFVADLELELLAQVATSRHALADAARILDAQRTLVELHREAGALVNSRRALVEAQRRRQAEERAFAAEQAERDNIARRHRERSVKWAQLPHATRGALRADAESLPLALGLAHEPAVAGDPPHGLSDAMLERVASQNADRGAGRGAVNLDRFMP